MTDSKNCPQCGSPLPADSPAGMCPKCLLAAGLGEESEPLESGGNVPTIDLRRDVTISSQPGTRLSYVGDYELLEEVARGGMGVVFKARQVSLDRIVAVKMILAGQLASPQDVERFHAEAEAAGNLRHPNIVAIHEVGEHRGQHYFSMDFVEGRSLAEIVRGGPAPPRSAAEYAKQIAEAIHYAHQRGTLHRDLKPSNVLIDASGQVHITDFGLAKRTGRDRELTVSGSVIGIPAYMPPEQAGGRRGEVSPASDVYSVGAVLYELLTGRPPFRGEDPLDTLRKVIDSDPVPPCKLNAAIPVDMATICMKCLEKQPARRYASAAALADDLDRFLNQQPIHARAANPLRKLWGTSKRRPWLLALLAGSVATILLSAAYWLWSENACLRYMAAHPDYVRDAGPFTKRAEELSAWNFYLLITLCCCSGAGYHWFRKRRAKQKSVPLSVIAAYGLVGALLTLYGMRLGAAFIQAQVWEQRDAWPDLTIVLFIIYFGVTFILGTVKEYEFSSFGVTEDSELTPEKVEEAHRLISEKKYTEAQRYCQRHAATRAAGREFFFNLRDALREQDPEKFKDLTLGSRFSRGCLIGVGAVFAAILIGILLVVFDLDHYFIDWLRHAGEGARR